MSHVCEQGVVWNVSRVKVAIDSDANDLVTRVHGLKDKLTISKRRRLDIADIKECIAHGEVDDVRKIRGDVNPIDGFTKKLHQKCAQMVRLMFMLYEGFYDPM
jgi:hypothetical protein